MINVVKYQNFQFESLFADYIRDCYDEVRAILQELPETINISFGGIGLIAPGNGVGGYSASADTIIV